MQYQIRPGKKEDIEELYFLICELAAFEGKDPASLSVTKERLQEFGFREEPYFSIEVAEVEGKVIAYTLYFLGFSAWQGSPVLVIDDLCVQPEYRNHGIGTALLSKLATIAQQHRCCRMEWHVFQWNELAISFYEGIGSHLRKDLLLVRLDMLPTSSSKFVFENNEKVF